MNDLIKALAIKFNKLNKQLDNHDAMDINYITHEKFLSIFKERDKVELQILIHLDSIDNMADIFEIHSMMWSD